MYGFWFRVYGLWFRVHGLWFRVYALGARIHGKVRCAVEKLVGFRVQGVSL